MPALVDLLDQFFFSDAPGAQARAALMRAWELASGSQWNALYVQSLDDALSEELPHLSAYSGPNTPRPTPPELGKLLTTELGEAGNHLLALDRSSGTFLTELARAMQAQRLIVIQQHNLFTDEYRQILLNLFDHAHIRFKATLMHNEPEFSAALASAAGYDSILIASISNFLTRAFNVTLPSLPTTTQITATEITTPVSENGVSTPEPHSVPKELESAPEILSEPRTSPTQGVTEGRGEPYTAMPNRLRVLIATPADVQTERAQLIELVHDLDTRARARFGVELALVNPTATEIASVTSAVELADIFIGIVWLQFGSSALELNPATNEIQFAGAEQDFTVALEQGSERNEGWLRTVIYRSIRPPLDLLHLNVTEYTRVQQFFERAGAYGGEDLVRVYNDAQELIADAHARLDAWTYNYAGDLANALSDYGKNSAASGQFTDALTDFDQAIALYRELDRPESELALWNQVGALHRNLGQRDQAAHAFDTALRLARLLEEDDAAAHALHQTGLLAADAKDWRGALRAYQQARAHLQPDAALYRAIITDEISALTNFGDAEEPTRAGDAYRDALALAQEVDDTPRVAALYERLGNLAAQQNAWQDALDAYKNSIAHLDATTPTETRRAAYLAQADAYTNFAQTNASAMDSAAWQRALDGYTFALAQLDAPDDTAQHRALLADQARAYQHLGDAHFDAQQYDAAGSAYRDALAIDQELDARQEQGAVLAQLGAVSNAQARWQEANAYFTQALPRLDAPESQDTRQRAQRAQAAALAHIGDAHRDAQEWGQAEIAYVQARGNLEQLGAGDETGALLVNLGIVTAAQARWQEGLAFFQQARARLTAPEQADARKYALRAEANTLRQLGDLKHDAGDYAQAQATYRQQLDLAQELLDGELEADAFHRLGRVAADEERWDDAVDLYDQALTRVEHATADTRAPIQRDQLAAYEKMGARERAALHFSQTEMAYRSALTLAQTLNEKDQEAALLNTLGLVAIEQEHWEEALVNLRRALGIYNLMPNAPEKPKVIWNIGRAQRGQKRAQLNTALLNAQTARDSGAWAQALPDLENGLQLARELGDAHTEGIILAELGDAAVTRNDWDAALDAYNNALPHLTHAEDAERRAQIQRAQMGALRQRSAMLRDAQSWSQADADLSIAREIARELNDAPTQGELVYESALVAAGQARWNDAINLYSAALDTFDETSEQRARIEGAQADAYRALGNSEHNGQNWQGAEASYLQALTLQRNRGDNAEQATLLAALGDVAMRQGEWSHAVEWLTQARMLTAETAPEQLSAIDSDLERATLARKRELQVEAEARGDTQRAAREFENAADSYTEALVLADELQDRPAQAELNAKLGFISSERGALENALQHYRVAAAAFDAPENIPQRNALVELQGQTLQDLGNRAGENGQWQDALADYQASIALLDNPAQTELRNTGVRLSAITLQNIGDQARGNAEWQDTLDAYRRAAGLFGILGASHEQQIVWAREANALTNLARQARAQNLHADALQLYRAAGDQLTAAQAPGALNDLQAERIAAYREAGDAFARQGDLVRASAAYQDGYALAQQSEDRAEQAELLYQLGQVQSAQAQWESALAYYHASRALTDESLQADLRANLSRAQQTAHHALGNAQRAAGDLERAEENYNGALTAALDQDRRADAGELYFILGMLAADTRAWDKALGNYALALDQMAAADSSHRRDVLSYQAFAFQEWGDFQRGAGQFDAASSAYTSALERAEELEDDERAGEILCRRGLLNSARGEWESALETFARAETRLPADSETRAAMQNEIALATRAIQRTQLATQLDHAQHARQERQWDDAATAYRAALALTRELDDTPARAEIEPALATLYADKADALRGQELWDEANEAYRESWSLAREFDVAEMATQRERDLLALAAANTNALRAANDWANAERAAQAQLALAHEFVNPDAQADALYHLGDITAREQKWNDAINYYTQARPTFVKTENAGTLVALDAKLATAKEMLARQTHLNAALAAAQDAQNEQRSDDVSALNRVALEDARALQAEESIARITATLVGVPVERANGLRAAQQWDQANAAYRQGLALAQEFEAVDAVYARQQDLTALAKEKAEAERAALNWDGARDAYREGLAVAHEFHDASAISARQTDLILLAKTQADERREAGDWANAQTAYRNALAVANEFGDAEQVRARQADLVALAVDATARAQARGGNDAIEATARAQFDVALEFGDLRAQSDALFISGNVAAQQTQWQNARDYFAQAARGYEQLEANEQLVAAQGALNQTELILENQARLQTALANAQAARGAGDYTEATQAYQSALEPARALDDKATLAETRVALAELAFEQEQWADALQEYTTASELYAELNQGERVAQLHVDQADTTRRLLMAQREAARARGEAAFQNAEWGVATEAYQEGLTRSLELREAQSIGEFQIALGNVAGAEQRWDAAAGQYDAAAASFASAQNPSQRAAALEQRLAALKAQGDQQVAQAEWQAARATYTAALGVSEQLAQPMASAQLLQALGSIATQENNMRAALNYYDSALATLPPEMDAERAALIHDKANAWEQIGDAEMGAHKFASAETAYQNALTQTRALGEDTQTAQVLHHLGLVRGAQDNWQGALDAHQEAYALIHDLDAPETQLNVLTSLAEAQQRVGALEEARENYQRALPFAQEVSDAQHTAEIERALGDIASAQGHWQDALAYYDASRQNYQVLASDADVHQIDARQANAYVELGEVLYGEGQWADAANAYTRTLEFDSVTGRTDRDGDLQYRIGLTFAAQENFVEAISHYDQAVTLLTGEEVYLRDRILAQLAHALQQEGKRAQAAGEWAQAGTVFTRARKMAEASDNFDQVADLWFRLGHIYTAQSRDDDALRAYRRAYEFDRIDGNALQQREISNALANALLQQGRGQPDQAWNEALTLAGQAENPLLLGQVLEAAGDAANAREDVEGAIDLYARAGHTFAAIEETERWRVVARQQANLLRRVAARELDANEFADAENLYRRAWLLQQAAGGDTHEAETHFGLGRALLAQERYEDALAELEQADALFDANASERASLKGLHADALEAVGAQAMAEARWDDAHRVFSRAVNYREDLNQRARAGLDWQQLAEIAAQQKLLDDAVSANENALARLNTPETSDARRGVLKQQAHILASIGDAQQHAGEWANASVTYRRALAIAQEQGDLQTLAQLYNLLGSLAGEQEHWDDARAEYHHALDVYQELEQLDSQAGTWTRLGDMHRQATQYDDAANAFENARKLYHDTGKRLDEGAMLQRLGHVQGDREEYDGALDQYQAALHLYNEIGARSAKTEVYRAFERAVRNAKLKQADQAAAQGDASLDAGRWADAEAAYLEALDLYDETGERALHAQMQNQLGVALEAQMRWDEALSQYRGALTGFEQVGIPEAQVGVLANIGDVQRNCKMWNEAEANYRQALVLNQDANDATRAGELYNSLGLVRQAQEDWDGAIDYYQAALAQFEGAGVDEARAETLAELTRARRGANVRAEVEYKRALELARAQGNLADAGEILNTLGLMAAEEKRWDDALNYYREAVTTFEQIEAEADMDPIWRTAQGTVLNNIGDASQQIGAWGDADYAYSRALGLAREIGDRESEAILLANLGVMAQEQQQLPRALDLNLQALESYRALGDETPRAEILERVGDLQMELEQTGAAETTYREALEMARSDDYIAANERERVARLLRQLGLLAEGRGADEEAVLLYNEALTRAVELERIHEQKALLARQGVLHTRAGKWEQAERAQQAALALATQQGDEPLQAELHTQLGETAVAREDWRAALNENQAALELYEKFDAPREQFVLRERIGRAHAQLGEHAAADAAYRAAIEIAPRVENANTHALWLERAQIAEEQNRWNDAAMYFDAARNALAEDASSETRMKLLFRRGDAAMNARDWSTADASFNDAMELANASNARAQYGWGINRLGVLAQAQREWDEALENFQEAIEILRVSNEPLGEAQVLNNIARLKLETGSAAEADLFAQAALTIAQTLGSSVETSRSLYTRGLVSLHAQEFEPARRFMNQAIAANPSNGAAQLQLGSTLLAEGNITEGEQQAEAGLGNAPDWELGAQTQLAIAALYQEDQRIFKNNLKRTRARLNAAREHQQIAPEFLDAVEWVLRAMEGNVEGALAALDALNEQTALPAALDAQRFARTALLALSKSPRRFKGKPALVMYFTPPKPRTRKGGRTRSPKGNAPASSVDETAASENPEVTGADEASVE